MARKDDPFLERELKQLLVCPKCGYDGNTDEGHGFRYLVDTASYQDVEGVKGNQLVIHSLRFNDEGYDHGNVPRFECRRNEPYFCGHEWDVPEWVKPHIKWL